MSLLVFVNLLIAIKASEREGSESKYVVTTDEDSDYDSESEESLEDDFQSEEEDYENEQEDISKHQSTESKKRNSSKDDRWPYKTLQDVTAANLAYRIPLFKSPFVRSGQPLSYFAPTKAIYQYVNPNQLPSTQQPLYANIYWRKLLFNPTTQTQTPYWPTASFLPAANPLQTRRYETFLRMFPKDNKHKKFPSFTNFILSNLNPNTYYNYGYPLQYNPWNKSYISRSFDKLVLSPAAIKRRQKFRPWRLSFWINRYANKIII